MKRILSLLLVLVMLTLLLAGCGSQGGSSTPAENPPRLKNPLLLRSPHPPKKPLPPPT